MQDAPKAVWSIPYVSVAFFPSLKQNFIAYRSSKVSSRPDCIFEIHQLWQSGFSRVYFNSCCSCSFEPEIIKIGQSSHKMYSNNILNIPESTSILNACTKKSGNYWMHHVYIYIVGLVLSKFFNCLNFLYEAWWFLSFRVFRLLFSSLLVYSPAFFRCLLDSGAYMELRTTSFIESTSVACSDSVNHYRL